MLDQTDRRGRIFIIAFGFILLLLHLAELREVDKEHERDRAENQDPGIEHGQRVDAQSDRRAADDEDQIQCNRSSNHDQPSVGTGCFGIAQRGKPETGRTRCIERATQRIGSDKNDRTRQNRVHRPLQQRPHETGLLQANIRDDQRQTWHQHPAKRDSDTENKFSAVRGFGTQPPQKALHQPASHADTDQQREYGHHCRKSNAIERYARGIGLQPEHEIVSCGLNLRRQRVPHVPDALGHHRTGSPCQKLAREPIPAFAVQVI